MIKNLQSLFNINECCIFFSYIKVSKDSSDKHNQNIKKKMLQKTCEKYQHLSEEEKNKKQEYGWRWY